MLSYWLCKGGLKMKILTPNIMENKGKYEINALLINDLEQSAKISFLFDSKATVIPAQNHYIENNALTTYKVLAGISEIFVADLVYNTNEDCFYVEFDTKDSKNQLVDNQDRLITYRQTDLKLYNFLAKEFACATINEPDKLLRLKKQNLQLKTI